MNLNRTKVELDREARNDENDNWSKLENSIRGLGNEIHNVVENISEEAFEKVINSAKLDWSPMVDTESELPVDAKIGDTVGVKENNKIYRYDGEIWSPILELSLTPLAEIDNRLTSQLAETVADLKDLKEPLNLIPPFTEWEGLHSNVSIIEPYKAVLTNGDGSLNFSDIFIEVETDTTYTLSVKTDSKDTRTYLQASVNGTTTSRTGATIQGSGNGTITTTAEEKFIRVRFDNNSKAGSFTFEDFMLSEGTEVVPFKPITREHLTFKADKSEVESRFNEIDVQLNPLEQDISASVSRDAFIRAMNKKAKEIGMTDTNFTNPHGLSSANQVTTAKDMLLMGINAISYKELTESWAKRKHTVEVKGDNAREIEIETTVQNSSMNDEYNVLGGKTGTLSALSLQNLISVVNTKHTNNWFIGCVLDASPSRYTASRQLFDISNTVIRNNREIRQHVSNLTNGDFEDGLTAWSVYAGDPTLTKDDYYSFPQSLRVNSTGISSQVRRTLSLTQGNKYYISAMVKCTRHSSGTLGVQFTGTNPSTTIGVGRTTNGWERVSGIVEAEGSSAYFYAGGISNADLDGYIDAVDVINLTAVYGAGKEPSKSQMDKYYWRDIASNMAIACQVPVAPLSFNRDNLPVLFEKNSEVTTYPASLTKVMTAIVMLDNVFDLNKNVRIIASDIASGSGPSFQDGDIISLSDALHCLMLPSSNTIANTVARIVGRKIFADEQ